MRILRTEHSCVTHAGGANPATHVIRRCVPSKAGRSQGGDLGGHDDQRGQLTTAGEHLIQPKRRSPLRRSCASPPAPGRACGSRALPRPAGTATGRVAARATHATESGKRESTTAEPDLNGSRRIRQRHRNSPLRQRQQPQHQGGQVRYTARSRRRCSRMAFSAPATSPAAIRSAILRWSWSISRQLSSVRSSRRKRP